MAKTVGGVLLAAIVLFCWGFVYWGGMVTSAPYSAWSSTPDDRAAARALQRHFPVSGTYYVPARQTSAQIRAAIRASGAPSGIVHVRYNAPSPGDPTEFAKGLGLNVLFAAALALLMYRVRAASRTYMARFGVALWAGVAAVLLIDGGDLVWWGITLQWKVSQAIYDFSAFVVAGAVLAAFMKSDARSNRFT